MARRLQTDMSLSATCRTAGVRRVVFGSSREIHAALHGEPLTILGEGKLLDFLWIEDAVTALLRASELAPPASILKSVAGEA